MRRRWGRAHPTSPDRRSGSSPLASLRHQVYRRFMLSQVLGSLCLWTHRTVHVWLTVVVTDGDPATVGLVTALQYAPMLLSGLGGGLGDRWSKRSVLMASQSVATAGTAVLVVLAAVGSPPVWALGLLAAVLGLSAAVDAPVRLAFPRELVGSELLRSAIGLNGMVFQGARIVGPALAGLIMAAAGEAVGFAAATLFGLGSLLALLAVPPPGPADESTPAADPWRVTLRRIRATPTIIGPVVGGVIVGAALANLQVALPLLVQAFPDADARAFGLVLAMIGAGGGAGALLAATLPAATSTRRLDGLLVAFCISTATSALAPDLPALALAALVSGLLMQTYNTTAITMLQDAIPDGAHGRILGLYVVGYFIWAAIGTPAFGVLAEWIGADRAVVLSAGACLVAALLLAWRGSTRATRAPFPVVPAPAEENP